MMVVRMSVDIDKLAAKIGRRVETLAHEVTQDLAETVIKYTPVDTGFLRGSWFASINDPMKGIEGNEDKDGAMSVGRISLEIAGSKLGDTLYILNGANYARALEFGTSTMRPRGFVRTTVDQAPDIAARTATRIKRL